MPPRQPPEAARTARRPALEGVLWPAVLVLAATASAFWPSLQGGFVNLDDYEYVIGNPWIQAWTASNLRAIWTESRAANYHPLVFMTHLVEHSLWGLDARGYHAVNLALHLIATAGVFACAAALGVGRRAAAVTALLFGIHPLHVESVAWVAERKDVLCAAAYLWALYLHLRPRAAPGRLSASAFGLYAAALLSKPMAVTWPVVTALCDWWLGRPFDRRFWMEKLIYAAPSAAVAVVTLAVQEQQRGIQPELSADAWRNVAASCWSALFYPWKLLAPVGLSVHYPRPESLPWLHIAAALLLVVGAAALWRWQERPRILLLGLGWYMATLLPVSGLVPIGFATVADRYAYLPSVGLLLLAAAGLDRVHDLGRAASRAAWVATALIAVILGRATWERCGVWKDSETLWQDAVRKTPHFYSHRMLGMARLESGRLADAEASFRESLSLREHSWARYFLGETLMRRGAYAEAAGEFESFLAAQRDYAPAHEGLGRARMALKQFRQAERSFRAAASLRPDEAGYHALTGFSLLEQGRLAEAEAAFASALALEPESVLAHYNLGVLRFRQGRLTEAADQYRRVLSHEPSHRYSLVNLGVTLRRLGKLEESAATFERAMALYPTDAVARTEFRLLRGGSGRPSPRQAR